MARIAELWVYHGESVPRTVKLKSARVTNTGFELDRAFCVVDTKGSMVWKGEAISLLSVLYRRSSPPSIALSQDFFFLRLIIFSSIFFYFPSHPLRFFLYFFSQAGIKSLWPVISRL